MNVTSVPEQIVLPGLAAMLTDGVTKGFTVIVILFEIAVVGLAQLALLVKTQITISPFTKFVFRY